MIAPSHKQNENCTKWTLVHCNVLDTTENELFQMEFCYGHPLTSTCRCFADVKFHTVLPCTGATRAMVETEIRQTSPLEEPLRKPIFSDSTLLRWEFWFVLSRSQSEQSHENRKDERIYKKKHFSRTTTKRTREVNTQDLFPFSFELFEMSYCRIEKNYFTCARLYVHRYRTVAPATLK